MKVTMPDGKTSYEIAVGTWVEVVWNDAPPSVALVLDVDGDDLFCWHPDQDDVNWNASVDQVIKVLGKVTVPKTTTQPNFETIQAMKELEEGKGKRFDNIEALFDNVWGHHS